MIDSLTECRSINWTGTGVVIMMKDGWVGEYYMPRVLMIINCLQ